MYIAGDGVASVFLVNKMDWILGKAPPWEILTPESNLFSPSPFQIANCKCLGIILVFLLSLAALSAYSRISALQYCRQTWAPAPILLVKWSINFKLETGSWWTGLELCFYFVSFASAWQFWEFFSCLQYIFLFI